ncbi:unnamed protein product [Didymodactylos carnosus]|uniref:Uncharacterized protein n=1 Tax=Didymodactylos carnosus TaxID=1234261 RepID=A0A8S2DXA0_9BILA|nr:unnamed protein product [Didymodactylos carnosus]CAF3799854.1 unnamed protein product [Didymodactylos carnosus]
MIFLLHKHERVNNSRDIVIPIELDNLLSQATMKPIRQEKTKITYDHIINASSTIMGDNENDFYMKKINQLSTKVNQQAQLIKERDAEIKRLKSTSIGMLTDEAAREYILFFADQVRQQTTAYKFNGNLGADTKRLELSLEQINEVLNGKEFIERYFGQVTPKKVHTSLVGCLRNQRGTQKKQQQQGGAHDGDEKDSDGVKQIDNAIEDDNSHGF